MLEEIKNLEERFGEFSQRVGELKGEYNTLLSQQEKSEVLIEELKNDELLYAQAVELLSLVQVVTRDRVKESFETIVTHALNFILNSDKYSFHLIFGRRGNLQELNFAVQTPDNPEPHSLLDTSGGGVINVVAFALRVVLMEISNPKINGFMLLDESFANLSAEYQPRASEFLKEINEKFSRQVVMITHSKEFIENSDYNKIEVK